MKNLLLFSFLVSLMFITLSSTDLAKSNNGNGTIQPYSMQLKALCGKQSTDIYIDILSAGNSNIPVPQVLKKISVKIRNNESKLVYNKNYFDVKLNNNKAVISLNQKLLHNFLEVTVHIKSEQTKNEKILRGKTIALLRPDLIISKITHPDTVNINTPFNIEAYIVEMNREVGATSNILLFKENKLIRTIQNVNIKAGGNISAAFQNLFQADTGFVNYKLLISNTSPAEYDTANNEVSFSIYFKSALHLHPMNYSLNYYLTKNIIEVTSDVSACSTNSDTTYGESSGFQCYYSLSNVSISNINNDFPIKNAHININTENGNFVEINTSNFLAGAASNGYYSGSFNDAGTGLVLNYFYNVQMKSLTFILSQYISNTVYISNQNGSVTINENHNKILDAEKFLTIDMEVKIAKDYYGGRIILNSIPPLQHFSFGFNYQYYDYQCGSMATYYDSSSYDSYRTFLSGVTDTTYFAKNSSRNIKLNVPRVTELEQNFPNPFNPTTTIQYRLADKGFVNLTVYDLLGNRIVILVNGIQNKGNYNVNFNGSNLASGVYIYRLKTSKYFITKKFILQK